METAVLDDPEVSVHEGDDAAIEGTPGVQAISTVWIVNVVVSSVLNWYLLSELWSVGR